MSSTRISLEDEAELRRISLRYAQGCDRRDAELLGAIFTEDALLEGGPHRMEGRKAIMDVVPSALAKMFLQTRHLVHNILVWVDGDTATGETYGFAHHISKQADGTYTDFLMAMTYSDKFVRTADGWRIKHRHYDVNWTQTLPIDPPQG